MRGNQIIFGHRPAPTSGSLVKQYGGLANSDPGSQCLFQKPSAVGSRKYLSGHGRRGAQNGFRNQMFMEP